jgi:trk system potassium uptake protein TrkA
MYVIVAGGGKVGANVTRTLREMDHEVTLIEQRPDRFSRLEDEFGPIVVRGDATEIAVLEDAGIARPPQLVLAVTGDDEDNLIISQMAREKYGVPKVVARVNDPRNQETFDLLGIDETVCATSSLLGLVEHEVPEHGLVKLLELRKEGLDVVEVQIEDRAPVVGREAGQLTLPPGARLITVFRDGLTELIIDATVFRPGDQVLAVVPPESASDLRLALLGSRAPVHV